jgi:hypothetical protein
MPIGNLQRQRVQPGKVVRRVLDMLVGNPVLLLRHLGSTNAEWMSHLLSAPDEDARALGATATNEAERQRNMLRNRESVARFACAGVEGFYFDGADGGPDYERPVPSTPDGIMEVMLSLSDDVFNVYVLPYVLNQENFRERPQFAPPPTADQLAKK